MSAVIRGVRTSVECFVAGVLDSMRFPHTAIFFVTSKVVRVRVMQCLLLNGGIFLSSVLLADYVLTPAFHWLLDLDHNTPLSISWLPATLSSLLLSVFYIVWVYPLYAISFLLNAIWYQDIADQAFLTRGHKQHTPTLSFQRWVAAMSEELYRLLLVTLFLVQLSLVSMLPVVGQPLSVLHMCWLYSLYSFEYKWALQGWRLETRLDFFERRWSYFAGFGCPAALLGVFFPRLIASGVFAMAFPMFVILAVIAKPLPLPAPSLVSSTSSAAAPFRLPIFHFAKRANLALLKQIKQTAPSQVNNSGRAANKDGHAASMKPVAQWPAFPTASASAADSMRRPTASTSPR